MGTGRVEAFSDGVIAIIITIMVLEMKVPQGEQLSELKPVLPVFFSYILSFIYIGIYWNNHHHMFHAADRVNGAVLWANTHLLFWLSLVPFASGWMGENHFGRWPVALYGIVLFMNALAYYILAQALIKLHGKDSTLDLAIGKDRKGVISGAIYIIAILLSFVSSWISMILYALVAAMWIIPDRRIEKKINPQSQRTPARGERVSFYITGFLGGKSKARASCSKCPLCEPSQKGLFLESPQRQKDIISLPASPYKFPFLSIISKSPSTFREPLLFTVILVFAIVFFKRTKVAKSKQKGYLFCFYPNLRFPENATRLGNIFFKFPPGYGSRRSFFE
jgi:uncharacterized membrane protein